MLGFVNFLGALTARMIGLTALFPPAWFAWSWFAAENYKKPSTFGHAVSALIFIVLLFPAVVFLSPGATQRYLRYRSTVFERYVSNLISSLVILGIMAAVVIGLPRLDPRIADFRNWYIGALTGLAGAFMVLFQGNGPYARLLAQRHMLGGGDIEQYARSARDGFADIAGTLTARLIGLVAAIHPLQLALLQTTAPLSVPGPGPLTAAAACTLVAVVFLIPPLTFKLFMPMRTQPYRVLRGATFTLLVAAAATLAAADLAPLLPGDRRLAATLVAPSLLTLGFVVMFVYPAWFARRLVIRAAIRQASPMIAAAMHRPLAEAARRHRPGAMAAAADPHRPQANWHDLPPTPPPVTDPAPMQRRSLSATLLAGAVGLPAVAFLFLAYYGWRHARFVPADEIATLGQALVLPATFVGLVVGAVATLTAHPGARIWYPRGYLPRLAFFCTLAGGGALLGTEDVVQRALPSLHGLLAPAPRTTITIEVTDTLQGFRAALCRHGVLARGEGLGGPVGTKVCGMDRNLRASLRPGDTIALHGYRTAYGFRYDRVTR